VRCPQAPQAKQQQKKRTFDVLQNADSFTRYGQGCRDDGAGYIVYENPLRIS
jgi:hypothetical protein